MNTDLQTTKTLHAIVGSYQQTAMRRDAVRSGSMGDIFLPSAADTGTALVPAMRQAATGQH